MDEMNSAVEEGTEEVMATELAFINEDSIEAALNNLALAQALSDHLDSGLTTQAAIKRTSVTLRNILLHVSRSMHKEYSGVIARRDALLAGVGDVQVASKKEALLKAQADIAAKLAALG